MKRNVLGVEEKTLRTHGAVSRETALEMAKGVREKLSSTWALSITGIAGPGGGTPEKPVGLVWIGVSGPQSTQSFRYIFPGNRETIRKRAALCALNLLRLAILNSISSS